MLDVVLGALAAAQSVRVGGSCVWDRGSFSVDLAIDADGNCAGTLGIKGGTGEIINGPEGTFVRGDGRFWNFAVPGQGNAIQEMLGDKWARMPADYGLADVCSIPHLAAP